MPQKYHGDNNWYGKGGRSWNPSRYNAPYQQRPYQPSEPKAGPVTNMYSKCMESFRTMADEAKS
eukprot:5948250-Karenia_brevis.AAC.1